MLLAVVSSSSPPRATHVGVSTTSIATTRTLPGCLPAWRRSKEESNEVLDKLEKVVVFGGGSFGTAMGVCLARQKQDLQVGPCVCGWC